MTDSPRSPAPPPAVVAGLTARATPATGSVRRAPSTGAGGPVGLAERAGLWPLRVVWFAAPLMVGIGLADRIERFPQPGGTLAEGALWAAWFLGLVACLVGTPVGLTVVRTAAPATVGLVLLAGLVGDGGWPSERFSALGYALLVTALTLTPVVSDRMINRSAYGSERRMALRPPAFALLGPIQLAWLLVFAGLVTGPLLVANGHWVAGAAACVVGAGAGWLGGRVLHQLARRWIVFVPAGFVIHDHVALAESVLLQRTIVASLGPAGNPLPEGAVDLSGGAWGLALEVATREPVQVGQRVKRTITDLDTTRLVFTPSLPGAVLREARIRAIRIAAADDAPASTAAHDHEGHGHGHDHDGGHDHDEGNAAGHEQP